MTANPEKGEFGIEIGGRPYVLAMTFNGLIDLQQLFSQDGALTPIASILARAQQGDLVAVRAVFWSTLRRHHPDITVEQAGDLITAAGGSDAIDVMVNRAFDASAPDKRDMTAVGGGPANPPKAARKRRGIGARLN